FARLRISTRTRPLVFRSAVAAALLGCDIDFVSVRQIIGWIDDDAFPARQSRPHLAPAAGHRTGLDRDPRRFSIADDPDDRLGAGGPARVAGDEDPRRRVLAGFGRVAQELDPGAHLWEDPRVALGDAHLHLHRRALPVRGRDDLSHLPRE